VIGHLHLHLVEPVDAPQRLVALGAADGRAIFLLEDRVEPADIVKGVYLEAGDLVGKLERVPGMLCQMLAAYVLVCACCFTISHLSPPAPDLLQTRVSRHRRAFALVR